MRIEPDVFTLSFPHNISLPQPNPSTPLNSNPQRRRNDSLGILIPLLDITRPIVWPTSLQCHIISPLSHVRKSLRITQRQRLRTTTHSQLRMARRRFNRPDTYRPLIRYKLPYFFVCVYRGVIKLRETGSVKQNPVSMSCRERREDARWIHSYTLRRSGTHPPLFPRIIRSFLRDKSMREYQAII